MTQEMNTEELTAVYDKLLELTGAGNGDAAQTYLIERMPRLPEEVRKEIIARAYFDSVVEEVAEIEAIADIQREGLAAIEILERFIAENKEETEA